MTLLAPWFLYAGIAAAATVVALHLIATHRPPATPLPTARFAPTGRATATVRSLRLTDRALMILRMLAVLALGAGLARPMMIPEREHVGRIIVADVSGAIRDTGEVRAEVAKEWRTGDRIVAFDSAAWLVARPESLGVRDTGGDRPPGSLSAALAAALRAAPALRPRVDSIRLIVISPLLDYEVDAATAALRALWPGRIELVAVTRAAAAAATAPARISSPASGRPALAVARTAVDTAAAIVAEGGPVLVAPFARAWYYPRDSIRGARVLARWPDGEPAAVETGTPSSCQRSISFAIDSAGDIPLRPAARELASVLAEPCGTRRSPPASQPAASMLATGPRHLAPAARIGPAPEERSVLAPWLIGFALALLLLELLVRRRGGTGDGEGGVAR